MEKLKIIIIIIVVKRAGGFIKNWREGEIKSHLNYVIWKNISFI